MSDKFMLVRVDASPEIGAGHFMRTLALAQEWQQRGGIALFMSKDLPRHLARQLEYRFELINMPYKSGSAEDASFTGALAPTIQARCTVIDGYQFGADYQRDIKSFGVSQLYIDDIGHCHEYVADIILNQNLHANESLYKGTLKDSILLFGPQYVLLRKQFSKQRAPHIPGIAETVLITIGGSDSEGIANTVANYLLSADILYLRIYIVTGHDNQLQEHLLDDPNITVFTNVQNMSTIMSTVDMAISGGGITVWELAFMGVPTIAITRGNHEEKLVSTAAEHGVVVDGGNAREITASTFIPIIRDLVFDPRKRLTLSRRGQGLIDGKGTIRVMAAIDMGNLNVER